MFSTEESLRRRTGPLGTGRLKYLQALVTEYQDTSEKGTLVKYIFIIIKGWSYQLIALYSFCMIYDSASQCFDVEGFTALYM